MTFLRQVRTSKTDARYGLVYRWMESQQFMFRNTKNVHPSLSNYEPAKG